MLSGISVGNDEAYAVGGEILSTSDHGRTWRIQQLEPIFDEKSKVTFPYLSGVWANRSDQIVAVGCSMVGGNQTPGFVLQSTDHGASWHVVKDDLRACPSGIWGNGRAVFVYGSRLTDDGKVYAFFLRSTDARIWSERYASMEGFFIDSIGERNSVLYTLNGENEARMSRDGGNTWVRGTPPKDLAFHDGIELSEELRTSADKVLDRYMESSHCASWDRTVRVCSCEPRDCESLVADVAIDSDYHAVGSVFVRSMDGGKTMTVRRIEEVVQAPALPRDTRLSGVWAAKADDVYAAGCPESYPRSPGVLLHSSDRGETWQRIDVELEGCFSGVWGPGPEDVYVFGERFADQSGVIFHSSDHGKTWVKSLLASALDGMWGKPSEVFTRAGRDGIWRSIDHGKSWSPVRARVPSAPRSNASLRAAADEAVDRHMRERGLTVPGSSNR